MHKHLCAASSGACPQRPPGGPAVPPARAAPPARCGSPAGAARSKAERSLGKRLGMG